jgi:hypothetical protein
MPVAIDITGVRSGKPVAIQSTGSNRFNQRMWLCRCDCGGTSTVASTAIRRGDITSCGCTFAPVRLDLSNVDADTFWRQVDKGDGCWLWTGRVNNSGYGVVSINGTGRSAHRIAWKLVTGEDADGCVLHHCDTPLCVRVDHLFVGSVQANNADKTQKGRNSRPTWRGEDVPCSKLTTDAVKFIRTNAASHSRRALATMFGVSVGAVADVVARRTWSHVEAA